MQITFSLQVNSVHYTKKYVAKVNNFGKVWKLYNINMKNWRKIWMKR